MTRIQGLPAFNSLKDLQKITPDKITAEKGFLGGRRIVYVDGDNTYVFKMTELYKRELDLIRRGRSSYQDNIKALESLPVLDAKASTDFEQLHANWFQKKFAKVAHSLRSLTYNRIEAAQRAKQTNLDIVKYEVNESFKKFYRFEVAESYDPLIENLKFLLARLEKGTPDYDSTKERLITVTLCKAKNLFKEKTHLPFDPSKVDNVEFWVFSSLFPSEEACNEFRNLITDEDAEDLELDDKTMLELITRAFASHRENEELLAQFQQGNQEALAALDISQILNLEGFERLPIDQQEQFALDGMANLYSSLQFGHPEVLDSSAKRFLQQFRGIKEQFSPEFRRKFDAFTKDVIDFQTIIALSENYTTNRSRFDTPSHSSIKESRSVLLEDKQFFGEMRAHAGSPWISQKLEEILNYIHDWEIIISPVGVTSIADRTAALTRVKQGELLQFPMYDLFVQLQNSVRSFIDHESNLEEAQETIKKIKDKTHRLSNYQKRILLEECDKLSRGLNELQKVNAFIEMHKEQLPYPELISKYPSFPAIFDEIPQYNEFREHAQRAKAFRFEFKNILSMLTLDTRDLLEPHRDEEKILRNADEFIGKLVDSPAKSKLLKAKEEFLKEIGNRNNYRNALQALTEARTIEEINSIRCHSVFKKPIRHFEKMKEKALMRVKFAAIKERLPFLNPAELDEAILTLKKMRSKEATALAQAAKELLS